LEYSGRSKSKLGTSVACLLDETMSTKYIPALYTDTKQHRYILGAYCWNDDTIDWQVVDWKNNETFIQFLEHLLVDKYPTGSIILVMDYVSHDKSAATLAALSFFEHHVMVL
jgi:hypothetical protein